VRVGARNRIVGNVTSIKKGSLMCLVKVEVLKPIQIASVMTLESLEDLELKNGDEVEVVVKAVNVLLIRH
jgi:molybdopterin-binding protein